MSSGWLPQDWFSLPSSPNMNPEDNGFKAFETGLRRADTFYMVFWPEIRILAQPVRIPHAYEHRDVLCTCMHAKCVLQSLILKPKMHEKITRCRHGFRFSLRTANLSHFATTPCTILLSLVLVVIIVLTVIIMRMTHLQYFCD